MRTEIHSASITASQPVATKAATKAAAAAVVTMFTETYSSSSCGSRAHFRTENSSGAVTDATACTQVPQRLRRIIERAGTRTMHAWKLSFAALTAVLHSR